MIDPARHHGHAALQYLRAESPCQLLEHGAGGSRGYLGVDLHRNGALAVPQDLHGTRGWTSSATSMDPQVFRAPSMVILGPPARVMRLLVMHMPGIRLPFSEPYAVRIIAGARLIISVTFVRIRHGRESCAGDRRVTRTTVAGGRRLLCSREQGGS